jgi:arginyl-tRNA synthetase
MIADEIKKLLGQPIKLEHPTILAHGDYACYARGKAPELVAKINRAKPDWLEKVEAVGDFVNFYLSPKFFVEEIKKINEEKNDYGKQNIGQGKKVIVEYSSPNIAKPFTVGHLRSTIIGDAIANLLVFSGYEVIRDNHLGDWGTQFGKQIVAIKRWGDEAKIETSDNPVKELVALYIKFHDEAEENPELEDEAREWFKKLEQGDMEAERIWRKCIAWSLKEFFEIYRKLNANVGTPLGESTYVTKSPEVYRALEEKKLMRLSEGADVVFFENDKLPPLIVRKKDGSSIYATRDLGADLARKQKYGDDIIIINEVGSEQSLYMRQLYEVEKMLGWFKPEQRVHVAHGLYRFKDGKMSTRKGNVIWLGEVIVEAIKRASEFNPGAAQVVGIGALKYNDLKRNSKQDIVFDWNEVMNLKGDSGPYLQYTCVRAKSVLEKANQSAEGEAKGSTSPEKSFLGSSETIPRPLENFSPAPVERLLYRFPEVVERAADDYAPNYLVTYLTDLAATFNSYYAANKIIGSKEETYRLALTSATAQVLENGLNLLGIQVPAKM